MPIKINLLAEAQELDELRRRDPVKRFILAGVILILLILAWSSSLLVKAMVVRGELASLENETKTRENSYKQVLENQKDVVEKKRKIAALDRLAASRFLNGTVLNALQTNTIENVSLVRFKVDQAYALVPEVKPVSGSKTLPKPATVKESITLLLSAKDKSPVPGDGVSKFQRVLSKDAYFHGLLDQTGFRLTTLGAAQLDIDGRAYLLMNLEGHLPEKIR
jgi:hypothetical protein